MLFALILVIGPSKIIINIFTFIKEFQKNIFFVSGVPRGRAKILFALILEIGPSNITINIFTFIKEFQKKIFFLSGAYQGGKNLYFLYY